MGSFLSSLNVGKLVFGFGFGFGFGSSDVSSRPGATNWCHVRLFLS
jgi:hypothetical protein